MNLYLSKSTTHAALCFTLFTFFAICEIIKSSILHVFRLQKHEPPEITCIPTKRNLEILKHVPTLKQFKPVWWGIFGRIQTLLQSIKKQKYEYNREIIKLDDGVDIALDWKEDESMDENTPIVVCLHGLGGDSSSPFLKTFTDIAFDKHFRSVVYNRRGHGGMSLIPNDFFSSSNSKIFPRHSDVEDMECIVNHITFNYPNTPKFLVGFSCGANLGVNYISKHKDDFTCCVSISNGYNIKEGTHLLAKYSPICDGIVCQFLKDILFDGRLEELKTLANASEINLDYKAIMKSKSFKQLEELLVSTHNCIDLDEYYNEDSCHLTIGDSTIPLLCLSNENDPLIHNNVLMIPKMAPKDNENIITVITKYGGHIGWIDSIENDPWYSRIVFEYFDYFMK